MVDRKLEVIEHHKQQLSIARQAGDRAGERNAYSNLGNAYESLGKFKQAIKYHEYDLSISKELGDRAGEGIAYANLGCAYESLGYFKQAKEYHEHVLSISKKLGDRAEERRAYSNLGNAYYSLGNFKQAIKYHEYDLSISKELGDRAGEGVAHGNLGNAYCGLGSFKQAIEYNEHNLSISKELGNRAGEGSAYGNLGNAYQSLGNFKQAIEYQERHLSICKELGDRAGEGRAYGNLGIAYDTLDNFEEAIKCHEHHLSISKELEDRDGEASAHGNLGIAYNSLGNFEEAIKYHEHHLSISKELGSRAGEGGAYGNLGNAYRSLGNFKQAIEYHEHDLSISKELGNMAGEGKSCYCLGFDFESLGRFSEALDYYRSSIKLFDSTRALLQSEDAWKISLRDLYGDAYTALWRTLLKNGETDEALCAAEQGRAQTLMDVLNKQYGIDVLPSTSIEPKEIISYFLNNISTQTVFVALDGKTISFWLLTKGKEVQFEQTEIEHESASVLIDTTLKEIGAGVGVRCENRSLDELSDDPLPTRGGYKETEQSSTNSADSLHRLYDVIIGPIADLLQGDQLIVVPDGPLCLAPYSALSESIRIHTVPSLSALKLITASPDDYHSKSGALLVGDPCVEDVQDHFKMPKNTSLKLPNAKKEVEIIGEILKIPALVGKEATKNEVLKRITSVALVHIAAHGCKTTGGIALAPNPERASQIPKQEDFLLTMSDVQAVRLKARLVVLSCCHSGCGEVKAEGVVGIARAFLCAGARSVLVSLWAIDDQATFLFMRSFYQHLADGSSASVALHQAMKSVRESQRFRAVKYWAPFVLIGDDVTLELGGKKRKNQELLRPDNKKIPISK